MRLSRDDILKAEDLITEEVDLSDLPGYNGSVLVRGMTGRERDEFESSMMERRGGRLVQNTANVRAKIATRCIVDDDGNRVFADTDVAALGEKSAAALARVFDVASRLSKLSEEDVEELTENFGGTSGGGSSSPSPANSEPPSPPSSVQ